MTLEPAMSEEAELLRRYADERSEAAFEEVVRRNLNLVHSAAIRQVGGNSSAAADIAQAVFTELACQANRLTRHPALVGWLYTTTHRMAARYVRDETRRRRREHEAHAMQETHRSTDPEADWNRLWPKRTETLCCYATFSNVPTPRWVSSWVSAKTPLGCGWTALSSDCANTWHEEGSRPRLRRWFSL